MLCARCSACMGQGLQLLSVMSSVCVKLVYMLPYGSPLCCCFANASEGYQVRLVALPSTAAAPNGFGALSTETAVVL